MDPDPTPTSSYWYRDIELSAPPVQNESTVLVTTQSASFSVHGIRDEQFATICQAAGPGCILRLHYNEGATHASAIEILNPATRDWDLADLV